MSKICPYPGLRPFNEDESVFFKGRDEHVKNAVDKLQDNKFLMITGASGEGKSSIIYAGIVPYAKAGFFHAQFTQWEITAFKPGGQPFDQFCHSIAQAMSKSVEEVKNELKYGYSSLVEMYKKSDLFLDTQSEDWKNLSAEKRVKAKRKASNLLIIADQFEEFFTHSENVNQGEPSAQAYLTINLILETKRLAEEENLPIYVVSSMRSDFFGNCSIYRFLPELIGNSNIFLPKLSRNEIASIIRDPAMLSNVGVDEKVVEYFLNAPNLGTDQLPIIQHAMNRAWKASEVAGDEIKLLNILAVKGASRVQLNDAEIDLAQKNNIDLDQTESYSLKNVINAHCEGLYAEIVSKYQGQYSEQEIEYEFKNLFLNICKISDGRYVREKQKYSVIAQNSKNETLLQAILILFCDEFNALLSPQACKVFDPGTLIDINHEALIRNWTRMSGWVDDDYLKFLKYEDLSKQYLLWQENDEADSFLLSKGRVDYFSDFFKGNTVLTAGWITKFKPKIDQKDIQPKINVLTAYFEASEQKILRFRRKRKKRVAATILSSILAIVILSVLSIWAFNQKEVADEQRQNALREKERAEDARSEAIAQKEKAKKNKNLAQKNLQKANVASRMASKNASKAKNNAQLAQKNAQEALFNLKLSKKNEKKAKNIAQVAEIQKDSANFERQRAEGLLDSTQEMLNKAVAKNMASKAVLPYFDEQINLNLASEAFKLYDKHDMNLNDPELFKAMNYIEGREDSMLDNNKTFNQQKFGDLYYNDYENTLIVSNFNDQVEKSMEIKSIPVEKASNTFFIDKIQGIEIKQDYSRNLTIKKPGQTVYNDQIFGFVKKAIRYEDQEAILILLEAGELLKIDISQTNTMKTMQTDVVDFTLSKNDIYTIKKDGAWLKNGSSIMNLANVNYARFSDAQLIYFDGEFRLHILDLSGNETLAVQAQQSEVLDVFKSDDYTAILYGNNTVDIFKVGDESPKRIVFKKNRLKNIFINNDYLYMISRDNNLLSLDLNVQRMHQTIKNQITDKMGQEELKKYYQTQ